MTKITRFEDITVWQEARLLCAHLFQQTKTLNDRSYKDQLLRAATSVMNNIAEGYERSGNKEFKKFLYIAKGSSAEVRSMLALGRDIDYFDLENYKRLNGVAITISRRLSAFIKTL